MSNIENYLDPSKEVLCQSKDMIITPLAQDYCRKKRIKITAGEDFKRQDREENKNPRSEQEENQGETVDSTLPLDHRVKQLIRKEFGVVREDQVQSIARVVLSILEKKA